MVKINKNIESYAIFCVCISDIKSNFIFLKNVLFFINLYQRNKLNIYNIKYDYHNMIIQHNNML